VSDRNAKHDIAPIDTDQVLERVADMSISAWSDNEGDPCVRHIGPMAHDFHEAFGTGNSDKCIPTVAENGVALAAIQALYRRISRPRGREPIATPPEHDVTERAPPVSGRRTGAPAASVVAVWARVPSIASRIEMADFSCAYL